MADLQQRLLADLTVLARPRHARWDELGLMAVRSFLKEELSALGELEELTWTPETEPAPVRASLPARIGQEKPHESQTPQPRADHPQAADR